MEFYIKVYTNINMDDEEFIKRNVNNWYYKKNIKLRPDRYDNKEPIRKIFSEVNISEAINLWKKEKLTLDFKRVEKPKFDFSIHYNRYNYHKLVYPSDCVVWLHESAGINLANEMLLFLIQEYNAGFGLLSTYDDHKNKHFISVKTDQGTIKKHVGTIVGQQLPGLYWKTYFGKWALEKVGIEKFNKIQVYEKQEINEGVIITEFEDYKMIGTPQAEKIENELLDHFGRKHFFNKADYSDEELLEL